MRIAYCVLRIAYLSLSLKHNKKNRRLARKRGFAPPFLPQGDSHFRSDCHLEKGGGKIRIRAFLLIGGSLGHIWAFFGSSQIVWYSECKACLA